VPASFNAKGICAISGPDGYVSPDWYEVPDQVPTWNYVAVHLRGTLERLPQDQMHAMLDMQSAHFEDQLAPKPPFNQNKPDDVRLRAADKVETSTTGSETQTLAHLMRHPPQS